MSQYLYSTVITICGNEEINQTEEIETLTLKKMGNNKYYVISDLNKWFDVKNDESNNSSPLCEIKSLELT